MKYLIIDNLNDYFQNKSFERQKSDCFAEIISSYINNIKDNTAILFDASEVDFVFTSNDIINYDILLVHIKEDNIYSALRLKNSISNKKVFFFSVNENLSAYLVGINENNYINFNESYNLSKNLQNLNHILNINSLTQELDTNIIKKCSIDKKLSRMNINIGSGCDRKCSFCSLSNTKVEYHSINSLIKEIKENLESGVKYFHINNHSFTSDLHFVTEFCNLLLTECRDYDFKWSCFIIPENITSNLEILFLLKKAKLDRVEIGVENINENILQDFNIKTNAQDVIRIINTCEEAKISSIALNYLIGSPYESMSTLQCSQDFIEKVLKLNIVIIDINLCAFYPDIDTKYGIYQSIKERQLILKKCVKRKSDCVVDTHYLSKMQVYEWLRKTMRNIDSLVFSSLYKVNARKRLNMFILKEYGIRTLIWKHIMNAAISSAFKGDIKSKKLFFLSDITKDNMKHYAPHLVSEALVVVDPKTDNKFIKIERIFSNKESLIDISEFSLYELMLAESSISDIFATVAKNDTVSNERIKNKLIELENAHLIYYIQILS